MKIKRYALLFNYRNRYNSRFMYAVADQDGHTVFHGDKWECLDLVKKLNTGLHR